MNQPFKPDLETAYERVTYEVTVGANGRMNLPADLRQRQGIASPGRIYIETDKDGEARIVTLEQRIKRIQALMRPFIRPGVSVVDELIAERRAEAAKDEAEAAEWLKPNG